MVQERPCFRSFFFSALGNHTSFSFSNEYFAVLVCYLHDKKGKVASVVFAIIAKFSLTFTQIPQWPPNTEDTKHTSAILAMSANSIWHLRGSLYRCSYLWLPLIFQQTSHLDCRGSSWDIKLAILLGLA